ncbi:uncharacterized protein crybg1b isoform X1 [Misgurnus anguillicaudatus]|uniref:uncharacterized protein crybg1b isoform X1 n=2 Tax=Misgurnus anguillicaudatus TaxID=75329 RepID=UPI003CCF9BDE
MAESPQERSPGVFSRIGSWLLWGWGSPSPSGDVSSSKTQQNSQEEASDEDSRENSSPAPATERNHCSAVEDHTPVPSEISPSLTWNAKHLRIDSAGGGGSRGQTSQVYLEETGEDTDLLFHSNIKHSKNSQSLKRREPNISLSEPASQVDLLDQEEPDQMGRRRSGRKRRGSQGDGGGAHSKSPTTSQPSSPAITSCARSPETLWAESAFEEAPKTVRECSRGEAPNSPEAGSYEDTVQTEWAEAHLSEDTVEPLDSPDDPVRNTLTSATDLDMDEDTVVRLTETPESKRRSVKVSHSEKFFAKKVFVTSKTPTEDQHEKLKRAEETMDHGLTKTEDRARYSDNRQDGKTKGRIADKISMFEGQATSTAKSTTNPRLLDIAPGRNVTSHLKQFTEPADTQAGSTVPKQSIKDRALNFSTGRKGDETFTLPSGTSVVSGKTSNGGHLKTVGYTDTSQVLQSTAKPFTSRDKPTVKPKPSSSADQTDSKSHNATEIVSTLSKSTIGLIVEDKESCFLPSVSKPSDETQQVKSPTRTGSRSKKRRSKDTAQPLSPTSKNKPESVQEVKDIKSDSMPKITSKPFTDEKTSVEKDKSNNSVEEITSVKPKEQPEMLRAADVVQNTENTPDTDLKKIKTLQANAKSSKEIKSIDEKERDKKTFGFKTKTVTSTPQMQSSPPSISEEKNAQTENSYSEDQTERKHSETKEQRTNSNKTPLVQKSSERERLKHRGRIVKKLSEELLKLDPPGTGEDRPSFPDHLKGSNYSELANSSSRKDVMQNRESETDIKVLPEKHAATCVSTTRRTSSVKSNEEQTQSKPSHKNDEKDCLTETTSQNKNKDNVTKTIHQSTKSKEQTAAADERDLNQEGIKSSTETTVTLKTNTKITSVVNRDVTKKTYGDQQSGENILCSNDKNTVSAIQPNKGNPSVIEMHTSLFSRANELFTEQPDQADGKATTKPALTNQPPSSLSASLNEKTTPPPSTTKKATPPQDSIKEKITLPPASSDRTTTHTTETTTEKATPSPDSFKKKYTPPPPSSDKTTTPTPKTTNEKATPTLASSEEKPTPPPALLDVKATRPPDSIKKKTTLPQATSDRTATPTLETTTEKAPPALLDEKTIHLPASTIEKATPKLALLDEKATPPPASTIKYYTPPQVLTNEKITLPLASSKEKPTPPPALLDEKTIHLPASTIEKATPKLALLDEKATPPPASTIKYYTPPQVLTNEKITLPPALSEEKATPPPATLEVKVTPPPALLKDKATPTPASSVEKVTPPPASSKGKTTPSAASSEVKATPPPASTNERNIPPPASTIVKTTPPQVSANEKSPALISINKPQSSDPATRKKEFVRKPLILPQIPSVPGRVSLSGDSPSSWLDVERPVRQKQSSPDPKPKMSSSVSETDLLEASREFDPDDFLANVRRLAMPFTVPQRKYKQNRLQAPPFAMPPIKEDHEKPFDPEEFKFGLSRRREFNLNPITSSLSRGQNSEVKEEDDKRKRINPERESIIKRSVLFKRAKTGPEEEEEKDSNEEPAKARSRLEKSTILSSLRNTKETRRKEFLSLTESPTDVLLSSSNAPECPPSETTHQMLKLPNQDKAAEVTDSTISTQTYYQGNLKPVKDEGPRITPDHKPSLADRTLTKAADPSPPSLQINLQPKDNGPLVTPDPKTSSAGPTATTVTDTKAPPMLPSFEDIKLPDYLERFLPKEPKKAQPSDNIQSSVSKGSVSVPGLVALNKAVDVQTTNNVPEFPTPPVSIPVARGFHRRPGKIMIFQQHQFTGQSFEFYRDEVDATHLQLSSVISIKVIRGCWILYEKPGFEGRSIPLEEEELVELPNEWAEEAGQTSVPFVIGSIRLAIQDYTPPRIELFSEPEGRGRISEFVLDTEEIGAFGLPLKTGSIKVHSGVWMIYSDPGFQGLLAVLMTGEYPYPEDWGFPEVGSLRPLHMGGVKVQNPNAVKAVLYEKAGLQGRCVEVQGDVFSCKGIDRDSGDRDSHGLKSVESLKILRGLWVGYEQEGFEGQQFVLEEGEYLDWRDWGGTGQNLFSLRPVITDFSSPHMKMFSNLDFAERGVNIDLLEPLENLANTDYGLQTRSIEVLSGAWIVFEEPGFCGQHYVLEKGLYSSPEDWGSSNSRILSVMPVILENPSSSHFKIQMFSEPEFSGTSATIEDKLPRMPEGFIMSSCRVLTGSWLAFDRESFSGSQCVVEEGDYPNLRMLGFTQPNTPVLSLQPVGHEFSLPSIVLFERSGFRGRRTLLKSSTVNLQLTESCTRVSSILVEGGIWVLYESNNFRGSQFLLKPGEVPDWPKLSNWSRLGSLRPLIQKQVHIRLRNKEAGLMMSVFESVGELIRIQASEETGGVEQIWIYQDGHLLCKGLPNCFVDVSSGVLMAGSRAVLSSEPDKPYQLWSITSDGLIRNNADPNLVLEVKGGQLFDKTQIILNAFQPNKLNQRWSLELL